MAILREQGINGQVEMAAAFDAAACEAVDVTMTDLLEGRVELSSFHGLAACGGFSYGDVLGAGLAGRVRSSSTTACASNSPPSLSGWILFLSGCAMAARCCRISRS